MDNTPVPAELLSFLSEIPLLTAEEAREMAALLTVRSFAKGTMLRKEGQRNSDCFFVLRGCIRQYHIIDGVEKTTAFFLEREAVASFGDTRDGLSRHYWSCAEDSVLIVGDLSAEQEMYRRFPKLEMITRQMVEQDFGKTQDEFAGFMTSTPEERYLAILRDRPQLIQRVPQHQLASYIGVTPESLSRLRKRIMLR